jgi:hypothetical protein
VYIRGQRHPLDLQRDTDEPTLAVTVMGGVAHYSDAGYDVHPAPPAGAVRRK